MQPLDYARSDDPKAGLSSATPGETFFSQIAYLFLKLGIGNGKALPGLDLTVTDTDTGTHIKFDLEVKSQGGTPVHTWNFNLYLWAKLTSWL